MASIEKLGLATQEQTVLMELLNRQHGLFLVVGLNREERLSTLRTLQIHLEAQRREIAPFNAGEILCESLFSEGADPVGALSRSVSATAVLGLTKAPVALIPEIEDIATLELACEQGGSGALVLGTIEGSDGAAVISSLLAQGADPTLISQNLLGVITQHAIRKACPLCRVDLAPSFQLEAAFEASFGQIGFPFPGFNLREGRGCHTCDFTGYLGSTMVYEFLHLTNLVREQVLEDPTLEKIDSKAMEEGMLPWEAKLFFRLKHGDIALRDAICVLERAQQTL